MEKKELKPIVRANLLKAAKENEFDMVIMGGGATGLGVAVDAASRGLKVCLVDAQDFVAGTSSRSTKLIHGGVRYMQNPRDWGLVKEAIAERQTLLKLVPYLVHYQPFILPCYRWYEKFFYGTGLSMYTSFAFMADKHAHGMKILSKKQTLEALPGMKAKGLHGGVLFYDAQFDDARMGIALMQTATAYGATCLNYAEVVGIPIEDGKIKNIVVEDKLTGEKFEVKGKMYFNCAGPWVDRIRKLIYTKENGFETFDPFLKVARGSHIVVDLNKFMPQADKEKFESGVNHGVSGMFIPKTSDGRVLFCIPFHGLLEIGTTDLPEPEPTLDPQISDEEIDFIIDNANNYLTEKITREDVLGTFCGVRPLYSPKTAGGGKTAKISREHAIIPEVGNMLTITGGKWTAYRNMAQHAMKVAAEKGLIPAGKCVTKKLPLSVDELIDPEKLENDLSYAKEVTPELKERLYAYAKRQAIMSSAEKPVDVLNRRIRLGQLNTARAKEVEALVAEAIAEGKKELAAL